MRVYVLGFYICSLISLTYIDPLNNAFYVSLPHTYASSFPLIPQEPLNNQVQ